MLLHPYHFYRPRAVEHQTSIGMGDTQEMQEISEARKNPKVLTKPKIAVIEGEVASRNHSFIES